MLWVCLPWFHIQKKEISFSTKIALYVCMCKHTPYNIQHSLSKRWKKKKENKKNNSREFGEPFFIVLCCLFLFAFHFRCCLLCVLKIFFSPFFGRRMNGDCWWYLLCVCVYVCRCVKFSKVVLVNVRNSSSSSSSSRDHQQVARFIIFFDANAIFLTSPSPFLFWDFSAHSLGFIYGYHDFL